MMKEEIRHADNEKIDLRVCITSTMLQAIISLSRDTSLPIRAMSQPTLVVS